MRFAATHKAVSYLMVTAAFLMLALSGELPPLLTALSAVGIGVSYFFDPQNRPWMSSRPYRYGWYAALVLSGLLLWPDTGSGDSVWDTGTRFLCVLLCARLFQRRSNADYLQAYLISFLMLLAASLIGASVLYAVCLLLYAVFTTWTLTLFHLRREMEENYLLKHLPGRHGQAAESERVEVERILNSRRVVGPSFLLVSGAVSVVVFAVAGLLFLLLPRVGVSLELPLRRRGLLLTGFADSIQLGSHGLLRENQRVVMRVETPEGGPQLNLRFRGMAFDHYQDGRWSRTQVEPRERGQALERALPLGNGYHYLGTEPTPAALAASLRTEVYLEPLETPVLFMPTRPLAVALPDPWYAATQWPLLIGPDDELLVRSRVGSLHYTVWSQPKPNDGVTGLPTPTDLQPYLRLPPELPPRIAELAQKLTAAQPTPAAKIEALVRHLQTSYAYTTRLEHDPKREPIDEFLFTRRRGHCEYFASSLAIMLRTLGIPSRSVNGYLGGDWNEYGRYVVVRQKHAHSWVEAYLPTVGWVTYDPTPLTGLSPRSGTLDKVRQLADSLEMGWNKYILEYDLRSQRRLADRLRHALSPQTSLKGTARGLLRGLLALGYVVVAVLFVGAALRLFRRARDRRRPEVHQQMETQGQLKRALALLKRRGFQQRPGETLQQLATRVEAAGDSSGPWFAELVQRYYAHRFGQLGIDLSEVARLTKAMARAPRSQSSLRLRDDPPPPASEPPAAPRDGSD